MEETQEQTVTMSIPVDTPQSTSNPQQNKIVNCPVHMGNTTPKCPDCRPYMEAKPEEISTEVKPKHPGGRPCEFCQRRDEILTVTKKYITDCKVKKQIPYVEELADDLEVLDDTMSDWASKRKEDGSLEHPEFSGTYKRLKMVQKLQLLKRTNGRFNPTGAIFQLKVNHGFIETEKRILAGDKTEPLQIEFINEKQLPHDD